MSAIVIGAGKRTPGERLARPQSAPMTDAPRVVYPVYVFERRHELETGGRILAGRLRLNIFFRRAPTSRQRHEMGEIVRGLTADAEAGRLPLVKVGWPGDGRRPLNAAETSDPVVMAPWNARAFTTFVRVDRSGEQTITRERAAAVSALAQEA